MLCAAAMGSNIAQVLRAWAVRDPGRVAVVLADAGDRALSYGELDARARAVAGQLAAHGVQAGDRIALSVPNGLGFLDAWFGGLYAGCTLLPIPPMSAPPELAARLAHAGCKALVSDPTTRALADAARASCPDVLPLDADTLADDQSTRAVDVPHDAAPGDTAMILYTSGTTAGAKGARISHASLAVHTAALVHHVLALDPGDEVLAALPLTHSYGIRMTLLAPFYAGARCRLLARFSAPRVRALLHAHDVTWFPGVPTMFHALGHDDAEAGVPRALRWCLSAGAPLPRAVRTRAEARLGVPVRQGFGLTEATFSTIATPDDEGAADTVGRAVFGVEVRVIDEAGQAVRPGTPGEVEVRGQNVMSGYLDDADATAAVLRDGWLRTGDVGVLDAAGRLTIVDRLKDVILRGGFNVYPAEVESVLLTHPAVRDAVVVGAADEKYGEEVVAVLVRAPDVALDLAALAAHCEAHLSKVKVPRLYALIDALPVGPSGKVLRREVRRLVRASVLPLHPAKAQ